MNNINLSIKQQQNNFKTYIIFMYQNRLNQRQSLQKNRSPRPPTTQHKSNPIRIQQIRLFALLLRKLFNNKIRRSFQQIKMKKKPRYTYLNCIDRMVSERIKQSFAQIVINTKLACRQQFKIKADKADIRIFLNRCLQRMYKKAVKIGFNSINMHNSVKTKNLKILNQCFSHIAKRMRINISKNSWRKICIYSQRITLQNLKMINFQKICEKHYRKNMRLAFRLIKMKYFQVTQSNLFAISQEKRKQSYDWQAKRRQFLINQRQTIFNLKQMVQNFSLERQSKLGQLKRDKVMKISQTTQKIKVLQRQLSQSQISLAQYERKVTKINLLVQKRNKLSSKSQGAQTKVHNLFNQLKYQDQYDQKNDPRSSAFIKVLLNKQKFKRYLTQYEKLKPEVQQFQVSNNIKMRNLVCIYQNIPVQSIKLSQQYLLSLQQNIALKGTINSLLSYHLLKQQGDLKLKQNNEDLQQNFQKLFVYLDEQRNKDENSQIRDSFISAQSSKSLKKKSSMKTSVLSNKSSK